MTDLAPTAPPPLSLIEDEDTGDRLLVFATPHGAELEIQTEGEEPWFTQKQLCEIFGVSKQSVSDHIKKFTDDGELDGEAVVREFRTTAADGKSYATKHYALDVAMYVGYRVNSAQGVLFRKWATRVLTSFATKGFVIHKRRLQAPEAHDRLRELRDTINDIRASDVPLYAELRRICALCQDYDPKSEAARTFFAHMRAKLYWAVTNHTPAMLLAARADADQPQMGMQSWRRDPPLQADAVAPQSYLAEAEMRELSNLTVIVLDVISDQLDMGRLTLMADAMALVDAQLALLGRPVLTHGGTTTAERADALAKAEYKRFDAARKAARVAAAEQDLFSLKQEVKALPKPPRKPRVKKAGSA